MVQTPANCDQKDELTRGCQRAMERTPANAGEPSDISSGFKRVMEDTHADGRNKKQCIEDVWSVPLSCMKRSLSELESINKLPFQVQEDLIVLQDRIKCLISRTNDIT